MPNRKAIHEFDNRIKGEREKLSKLKRRATEDPTIRKARVDEAAIARSTRKTAEIWEIQALYRGTDRCRENTELGGKSSRGFGRGFEVSAAPFVELKILEFRERGESSLFIIFIYIFANLLNFCQK